MAQIAVQARAAIDEADLVLFVVDAQAGVTPGDEELADILRRAQEAGARAREQDRRPVARRPRARVPLARLRRPVPALWPSRHEHRRPARRDPRRGCRRGGVGRSRTTRSASRSSAARTSASRRSSTSSSARSGRSSRTCPGTTRDAIDTVLVRGGRTYRLVDTAGLRRKRRQRQGIDFYSELRALEAARARRRRARALRREPGNRRGRHRAAEVARQRGVLDADRPLEVGRVDRVDRGRSARAAATPAPAPAVHHDVGAHRPRHRRALLERVAELYDKHTGRIPTGELNRFLGELREARQTPSKGRAQPEPALRHAGHDPPAALPLHRERPGPLTRDYGYWVENQLRERYELEGVPGGDRLPQAPALA